MKKLFFTAIASMIAIASFAQSWKLDAAHSKVHFTTKYMVISDVDGEFKKVDGTFASSKPDWSDLNIVVTADVNSISTDNEMRDNHIKSDEFFNAEKYPTITFKSKSVKNLGGNKFILTGDLTIRDVTKKVEIPVVYNGTVKDPWGNTKAGFKATGKINRKEFNLKYSGAAATGEAVVGDEVEFTIDLVLIKQQS
jgi:polyisoprenoid-binding protein YceI